MSEFYGGELGPNAPLPTDVTIPQFMLDPAYTHPLRPPQGDIPCFIEDATGRRVSLGEVRDRTTAVATVLKEKYKIGDGQVGERLDPKNDQLVIDANKYSCAAPIISTTPSCCGLSPPSVEYSGMGYFLSRVFLAEQVNSGANPSYTASEIEYQLKVTEATFIVAHSSTLTAVLDAAKRTGLPLDRIALIDAPAKAPVVTLSSLVSPVLARGAPSFSHVGIKLKPGEGATRVAMLCMSSGTTGPPKAVAITHAAIVANMVQMRVACLTDNPWLDKGDVVLGVLPFFHVAGLVFNLHFMIFSATTLVVIPKFDFLAMLESIVRYRLVPPIAVALAKHPVVRKYDLSGLKFIGCGAAPLTSELQEQLVQLFPQVKTGQAYGLTETATILSMTPFHVPSSFGSVGRLIPGVRVRLVKPDGSLAGPNEPGELVVKTPSLSLGYHKNKKATEESFSADGWFRTGDQVVIKDNGEVWVTDRLKELIKVQGFQVSPAELEGLILDHPDVSDTCVVGAPDDRLGEVPLAFVVLTADAEKRAKTDAEAIKTSIKKLVSDNKIRYKHLADVEFVAVIPKNASGKILRRILTEEVRARVKSKSKL
ncbi:hypothetical protein MIND_00869400 [Mycena indigotica]|uniref:Uncharacterized protein n=1 Tax=Mycena indigotica TaxID=2126181 RepID=A0A8H6VZ80_9AGAR|nr:uncharacterized protein MIND_00869400 [Mycena indigotica]KAF7299207.1 hypothetical protein MIND_00869400 [Mycena indigotica]